MLWQNSPLTAPPCYYIILVLNITRTVIFTFNVEFARTTDATTQSCDATNEPNEIEISLFDFVLRILIKSNTKKN